VLFPEHFPQLCKIKDGELRSVMNTREIMTLEEMELSYIEWQVQNSGLGRDELAEKLGVSRRTLFRKLRKLQ
jgi:two-component system response regulator HydG